MTELYLPFQLSQAVFVKRLSYRNHLAGNWLKIWQFHHRADDTKHVLFVNMTHIPMYFR